jgi:quinol monooxygenase YgiN
MTDYVVLARFQARPDRLGAFLALLDRHADLSRAEPGCQVFDVYQDTGAPEAVVLYEVYRDASAYADHRATPHYARFREVVADLVEPGPDGVFQDRRVLSRHTAS